MENIKLVFKAAGEIQLAGYDKVFIGKIGFPYDVGDMIPTVARFKNLSCDGGESHTDLALAKGEGWRIYLA